MSFVVLYCLLDFLLLQLGAVFFFLHVLQGMQNCARRIFDFSDGSIVQSPLLVSMGELIRGVVGKFFICFANLQNAVVFVSIDEIWFLQAQFFVAIIVRFLIASSLIRLCLYDGRRVVHHILQAFLVSFVALIQREVHHGFLGFLFILVHLKCLGFHDSFIKLYAILGNLADDRVSGVTVLSISSFPSIVFEFLMFVSCFSLGRSRVLIVGNVQTE